MEVIFLREAEDDLFAAWQCYEDVVQGLGDRFGAEVRAGLTQLSEFPESAPHYAGGFRRLLVRRFEHGVFYRVHGGCIVITAILDLRQDPAAIRHRLHD